MLDDAHCNGNYLSVGDIGRCERSAEEKPTTIVITTEDYPPYTSNTLKDFGVNAAIVTAVFRLEGIKTITTIKGKDALKILQARQEIHLMFCDIIMPGGIDGSNWL